MYISHSPLTGWGERRKACEKRYSYRMTLLTYLEFLRPRATMMRRVFVFALILAFGSVTFAQQPAEATLNVVVFDPTGVRVPQARVSAQQNSSGEQFRAVTSSWGDVDLHLQSGIYVLRVEAKDFMSWQERDVEVIGELQKIVRLRSIGYYGPTLVMVTDGPPIEQFIVAAQIPLEPIQQLPLTATKLQGRKRRWF